MKIRLTIERDLDEDYKEDFESNPLDYVNADLFLFLDNESTRLVKAEIVSE